MVAFAAIASFEVFVHHPAPQLGAMPVTLELLCVELLTAELKSLSF